MGHLFIGTWNGQAVGNRGLHVGSELCLTVPRQHCLRAWDSHPSDLDTLSSSLFTVCRRQVGKID